MLMRCFVALNLSPEEKRKIGDFSLALKKDLPGFKFVESDNIHLTLRFLGDISLRERQETESSLGKIAANITPFALEYDGLVALPSFYQSKILGIGIRNNPALTRLYGEINSVFNLLKIGDEETRAFIPHLTLARARGFAGDLSFLRGMSISGRQKVASLELMKSDLSKEGANYKIIQSFNLCQK